VRDSCNTYSNRTQCAGFAALISKKIHGEMENQLTGNWLYHAIYDELKPGDCITYASSSTMRHAVVVVTKTDDYVTVVEANYGGHCEINWDRKINRSFLEKTSTGSVYATYIPELASGTIPELLPPHQKVITQSLNTTFYWALWPGMRWSNGSKWSAADIKTKITKLQKRLNELGYTCGAADGAYGTKTKNAVIAFQNNNYLYPSGVACNYTQLILYSDIAIPADQDMSFMTTLDISDTGASDISFLEDYPNLEVLDLYTSKDSQLLRLNKQWDPNTISDLSPLENMSKLRCLNVSRNSVNDLTPLAGLTSLTELYLYSNQIRDISPLQSLTGLTRLNLGKNNISDISPLQNLTNLKYLSLQECALKDLTPLGTLTALTELYLGGNQISDIAPLESLTNLTVLYLWENQISDITPLQNLTKLKKLLLHTNQISDVTALESLTNLGELWLANNALTQTQINILQKKLPNTEINVEE